MSWLRNTRFVLCFIIILFIGCVATVQTQTTEAKKPLLSTQKHFAKLKGEKVESDDSGTLFKGGGLTATYSGPEELFPAYGKYGELFSFMPLIRWYDPDHYFSGDFHPGSPVQGEYTHEQCV
ncbi:MAG: hypothetical protein ACE5KK_03790, partial [Candidatus Brocadiales bacterium]